MNKGQLTTHELARLLLESKDLPVATNVGYESSFARDEALTPSLIQLQKIDEDTNVRPDGIKADEWMLIGGDGFSDY